MGATEAVIGDARHPYTQLLLSAVPGPDRPSMPGACACLLGRAEEVRDASASSVVEQVAKPLRARALGAA